jgi:hypothetical protein
MQGSSLLTDRPFVLDDFEGRDAFATAASVHAVIARLDAQNLLPGDLRYDLEACFERVGAKGAVPWDPSAERLDSLGAPHP